MKKIMFNERYGLQQSVLDGSKTMTRRKVNTPPDMTYDFWNPVMGIDDKGLVYFAVDCIDGKQRDLYPKYQIGEEVAVAQAYKNDEVLNHLAYDENGNKLPNGYELHQMALHSKGYTNKLYVRAELMPHRIKITNIKLERLQDISNEDCLKEGILRVKTKVLDQDIVSYIYKGIRVFNVLAYKTPQSAFQALITCSAMMGKKTWDDNPWVYAYTFELIR